MTKKAETQKAEPLDTIVVEGKIEKAVLSKAGVDITFKGLHLTSSQVERLSGWIDEAETVVRLSITNTQGQLPLREAGEGE